MYRVNSSIILQSLDKCYETIITIHPRPKPESELYKHIRQIQSQPLSKFQYANDNGCGTCQTSRCVFAFINPESNKPFCIHELTEFLELIITLGYGPDYSLTKLLTKKQPNGPNEFLFYMTHKN